MDIRQFLAVFLPIIVYLLNSIIKSNNGTGEIKTISPVIAIIHATVFSFVMAFSDPEFGDKGLYSNFYSNISYMYEDYKDLGWMAYVVLIKSFINSSDPIYFFCITALIYTFSYCYHGYRTSSTEYWGYFIVLASGMMGFYSYGVATIRNGFALGMVLIAMANKKWYSQIPFFFLAVTLHKSCLLVVAAYYFAKYYNNIKVATVIWIVCFFAAAAGFSILPYMDAIGGLDSRIESYAFSDNEDYNRGFRLDFIAYSLIPAIISLYWVVKCRIEDKKYKSLLTMYILINAFWLLVITMPYTNRISYLSWFLIPILITYPFFNNLIAFNKQKMFNMAAILLLFVRILLATRE